jgi:ATP-dependent Clp protease ATP-binding subunit ClpA
VRGLLQDLLMNLLKKPLANEIIHGKLADGGSILVDTNKNEFVFKISKDEYKKKVKEPN